MTDLASALNDGDWQELIELSRQLIAQIPILAHAVRQKNEYAYGDAWIPQYRGKNKEWGDAAERWIHDTWLPQCSYQGGFSDWQTDLFLSGVAWDIDGDDVALFVLDEEDDNFPRIAYRSAHQIGSGGVKLSPKGLIESGLFEGGRMCNGIATDKNGRFLGVRLLRSKYDPLRDEQAYQDIPANQCDLQCEPFWRAQLRGIPRLAVATLDSLDLLDTKTFIKRGVKLDSSIGLMHTNEQGEAAPNSNIIEERVDDSQLGTATASDIKIENRFGGEIMYMRAGIGEKLESLKSDRPHPNAMEFLHTLERSGLLSLGWFRELVDPSSIGGASVRLIQDQARTSILSRQRASKKRGFRGIYFALSTAMNTKRIPINPDPYDWMEWAFGMPALLTVDAGYDEQADRENLTQGTTTLDAVSQKKGHWWQVTRAQRTREADDLIDRALVLQQEKNAKISETADKLSLRDCIQLIQSSPATQAVEGLRQNMAETGNQERA